MSMKILVLNNFDSIKFTLPYVRKKNIQSNLNMYLMFAYSL